MGQGPQKWTQINLGDHLGSISEVLDPFLGANNFALGLQARRILGHILTFFDSPCKLDQIFLVQNGLHRCPTYSALCFMFNSHL